MQKNAIFSKTKQFRATRLLTTYMGFVYSADANADCGRGLCVFGGLCVDM